MTKRKGLSKKIRFEVFKRDSFKCQYCGKSAPDVVLHADHIHPVSKGGDNDIMNLVTACENCNQGKKANLLSDNSIIEKQRKQLEELNVKREQLEMMLEWREQLKEVQEDYVTALVDHIESYMSESSLNDNGLNKVRAWLKRYSISELMDATDISAGQYIHDTEKYFDYIPRIAANKRKPEYQRQMSYICGILNNRLQYFNKNASISLMKKLFDFGHDLDEIKELAKTVGNWTEFRNELESTLRDYVEAQNG